MAMPAKPTRIDLLELDIDVRLAGLWKEVDKIDEWNLKTVATFIRAAYGKGYCDARTEDEPDQGELCLEHGYRAPQPIPKHLRFPAHEMCDTSFAHP